MKRLIQGAAALILLVVAAFFGQGGTEPVSARSSGSGFDYYVLVLSWSPSYCESEGDDRNSAQCSGRRPYGFVAHGLWPQYEKGYPEFCDVRRRVPERTVDQILPIMPAKGLIFHQWKKHGTCSGMEPRDYFDTVKDAYDSVRIPKVLQTLPKEINVKPSVIEEAFVEVNADLDPDEIVISCNKNRLREVKICLDKDLEPRRCGADVHRECRAKTVRMPPVRGG